MTPQIIILVGIGAFCAICMLVVRSASGKKDRYHDIRNGRADTGTTLIVAMVFIVAVLFAANVVTGGMVAAAILG